MNNRYSHFYDLQKKMMIIFATRLWFLLGLSLFDYHSSANTWEKKSVFIKGSAVQKMEKLLSSKLHHEVHQRAFIERGETGDSKVNGIPVIPFSSDRYIAMVLHLLGYFL
jgi:hypothetical protein